MVNTGYPSRACKLCRSRRIKCDETKPTCLKCAKAKRVCPGYRDAFEINLRDETQSTIRKARTAAVRKASKEGQPIASQDASDALFGDINADAIDWSLVTLKENVNPAANTSSPVLLNRASHDAHSRLYSAEDANLPRGLDTPLDQQATCFFLSNYVLAPPAGVGRGILTFLLPLIDSPRYKASPMHSAFKAVSMAALAGRPNSRSLFSVAHMHYSKALEQLTRAMQDKDQAQEDTSLATSILLAFYEGLANDENEMSAFSQHISGAAAMIKLRGPKLLDSPIGLGMFEFVRSSAICQYMFLSECSIENISWWARQAVADRFGHHALVLNLQTTLVRAEADQLFRGARTTEKVERALALLQKAQALDAEIIKWFDACPPKWRRTVAGTAPPLPGASSKSSGSSATTPTHSSYSVDSSSHTSFPTPPSSSTSTFPLPARSSTFSPSVYSLTMPSPAYAQDQEDVLYGALAAYPNLEVFTYPNVWAAGKYINTHVSRLLLAQVTARCIAWVCYPANHTQTQEYQEAHAMGREQVEAIISSSPYFSGWTGDAMTTPYFPCGTAESPKGLASLSCMWPLLAAGMSRFSERSHRAFVKGRLANIGETMGIRQAEVFSRNIVVDAAGPDRHNSHFSDSYIHLRS